MGKKGVVAFRVLLTVVVVAITLQSVAASSLSGYWLDVKSAESQATQRQYAQLKLKAQPVTTSAYLGEIIELGIDITNVGNMIAKDIVMELEGGTTLLASPQQINELAPGKSISLIYKAQIIGWSKGNQKVSFRATSSSLLHSIHTRANIIFTPQNAKLKERIVALEDVNKPIPVQVEGEWVYRGGIDYHPHLRFELRNGVLLSETLQIKLTDLLTPEQMTEGHLILTYGDSELGPVMVDSEYDSNTHTLLFTPTVSGNYSMRFVYVPVGNEAASQNSATFVAEVGSTDPAGWTPTFHDPTVALYNGAASYNYPLLIPPGPAGLQPNLSLNYNSSGSNGIRGRHTQGDPFGWGWQLDGLAEISQAIKICGWGKICPKNAYWGADDHAHSGVIEFTLNIGGTGYELTHENGAASNGYTGRYFLKGNNSIYVAYCGAPPSGLSVVPWVCSQADTDDGVSNGQADQVGQRTKTYWVIVTPDNTTYRLGYFAMSEQELLNVTDALGLETGSQMGPWTDGYGLALRWRVDKAYDRYDNVMLYHYAEDNIRFC